MSETAKNSPNISCPVCLEEYNEKERVPKVFQCGHSLCLACTIDLVKPTRQALGARISLPCPVCRQVTVCQTKAVGGVITPSLPTKTDLKNLLDQLKKEENGKQGQILISCGTNGCDHLATCDGPWSTSDFWVCVDCKAQVFCATCICKRHSHHFKHIYNDYFAIRCDAVSARLELLRADIRVNKESRKSLDQLNSRIEYMLIRLSVVKCQLQNLAGEARSTSGDLQAGIGDQFSQLERRLSSLKKEVRSRATNEKTTVINPQSAHQLEDSKYEMSVLEVICAHENEKIKQIHEKELEVQNALTKLSSLAGDESDSE